MKIVVVGLGAIGQRHARNLRLLRPACQLIGLRRPGSSRAGDELVDKVVYSLEEAIESKPQAGIVAGPASQHLAVAEQFLRSGLDVFVEKPLATGLPGCAELAQLCLSEGRIAMVGYNLRFHPATRLMRETLQSGRMGPLLGARFEVGQYLPDWRPQDYRLCVSSQASLGGGALLELSHELDLCLWLLGEASRAFAHLQRSGTLEVSCEDQAEVTLMLANQRPVSIHLDMLDRGGFRGCRLQGSEASLLWNHNQKKLELAGPRGVAEVLCDYSQTDPNQTYLDELSHFLECLETRREPEINLKDGMKVMRLVEAIRQADRTGGWQNV